MSRIPDEIIQRLRDHCDVVEIIGRVVSLKRAGRNYKGLCPFHDEKTPSFNVNPDRQSYYCFGCQEGGDVFSFLMKMEGLSFVEAARSLARSCGVELPESSGEGARSEPLFDANTLLAGLYREELARGDNPGAAYLRERGIDAETIERFGIGFVPDRWDFAVQALRGPNGVLGVFEQLGLLIELLRLCIDAILQTFDELAHLGQLGRDVLTRRSRHGKQQRGCRDQRH